jgi:ATP adenylyltransferase/5',5'''-P-1,P-4-tetraphosphate phosphorylase II
MRGIADRLHSLGFELLSASCFKYPVKESLYEHTIIIDIEFRSQFSTIILGDLSTGWKWYTEVAGVGWPMMALSYSERFLWLGFISVEQRIKEITDEFETYLDTRDKEALGALRLLTS